MPRGRYSASRMEEFGKATRERVLEDLERIQLLIFRLSQSLVEVPKPHLRTSQRSPSPLQLPSRFQPFGARVKGLRTASGMTLDQVARALGSHKGYVSGIET